MNPQIRFGEDLMSRVSYVMMNPAASVSSPRPCARLDELIGELIEDAGVDREHVLEIVLVGNPIMHHIALGIDPTPLGSAPFVLATDEAVTAWHATSTSISQLRRSTPGRASPVTSAPTPRRPCSPRARTVATRCNSSSTSAPTPRSCSATAPASTPRRARPGRRSRVPRSAAGSAHGGRHRTGADRPRDARAVVQGDRVRLVVRDPGFDDAVASSGSPVCAARASSTSSPRCTWRD